MQVRIQPIVVKVGDEVPKSVFDWKYSNLMLVYTTISLPALDKVTVNPTDLKKYFKGVVLDKSTHFAEGMPSSSETSYMKKACNILVHKMFERHGIDLTSQTPEQIRKGVLKNVKYCRGLKDFSAIDTVLAKLISFLSQTYVSL